MADESQTSQDARIQQLFVALDVNKRGHLDPDDLRKGLKKIDHPLKNAANLVEKVVDTIDANNDGKISYQEFQSFVKNTEGQLRHLFHTIDRNGDGKLDKRELQAAFRNAGLTISNRKLEHFFDRVDTNNDGAVTFDEWRDFLLFLPSTPNLENVLSYYTTTVRVSPEGDVLMSDDAIEGLGYFAAGGLAGVISRTSTAPLDRLKVHLIAQIKKPENKLNSATTRRSFGAVLIASYQTFSTAFQELWRAGGVRSLYAGNGLNVIKVMPESSIKFGFFEGTKRICARFEGHNNPRKISGYSQALAGGVSGLASQFFVYPLDTLKFRVQCETVESGLRGNQLILATAKKMWMAGGIRPFYKGISAGLLGIFPYAAIDLGTFEYLKTSITEKNAKKFGLHEEDAGPSSAATAAIGGFSGALGASLVYPINLVRTRLQTQGTVQHQRTYDGFWDATRQTVKGEGFKGLFKGLIPNLVKVVPAVSITYVVYEKAKKNWGLA